MAKKKFDGAAILALPMQRNDAKAKTVRGYLVALVRRLWIEQEGFSGKRPFGNSGWSGDLAEPLVKAGVVSGKIDADGYIDDCDDDELAAAVLAAIDAL